MPGKRFNFRITAGALKGSRARLLKLAPEIATLEVQGYPGQFGVNQKYISPIPQKTTRPRKSRAANKRRPR
jgi:hypothetical protein